MNRAAIINSRVRMGFHELIGEHDIFADANGHTVCKQQFQVSAADLKHNHFACSSIASWLSFGFCLNTKHYLTYWEIKLFPVKLCGSAWWCHTLYRRTVGVATNENSLIWCFLGDYHGWRDAVWVNVVWLPGLLGIFCFYSRMTPGPRDIPRAPFLGEAETIGLQMVRSTV